MAWPRTTDHLSVAAFTDAEDNQPAEEPVDRIEKEVIPKGQLKHT